MTSTELTYWMAYGRVRPVGDEAQDWQTAILSAASLSAFGGKAKVSECLPDWWGEQKKRDVFLTIDESVAWAKSLAGAKG